MKLISTVVKGCFALLLFNFYVFSTVFDFHIAYCTQMTTMLALFLIALDIMGRRSNILTTIMRSTGNMLIYLFYISFAGMILFLINSYNLLLLLPYFEKIVIAIIVTYIIRTDHNMEFIFLVGMLIAAVVAVYGVTSVNSLNVRLRLSESVSENTTGLILTFGILSTFLTNRKIINRYVKLCLNVLYIACIVLTASRQALLQAFIIYVGWYVSSGSRRKKKRIKVADVVFLLACAALVVLALRFKVLYIFEKTKLFARLTGNSRSTDISDQARVYLYRSGFESFLSSPILGTGFNNLPNYTHSTYLEVLGGTGFLGTIIYFFPVIKQFWFTVKGIRITIDADRKNWLVKKLILIAVLLVMMISRAVHYYIISTILLALVFYQDGSEDHPFTHIKV